MPNLWRAFQTLLPESPVLIGTVITRHTDGTISVQLLDGGLLRVSGEAIEGARVFVRDRAVIGPAPVLPTVDIEI